MRKIKIEGINGNQINNTIRCQFCGSNMEQGGSKLGSGINTLSYKAMRKAHSFRRGMNSIKYFKLCV